MSYTSILLFLSYHKARMFFAAIIIIAAASVIISAERWTLTAPELFPRSEVYLIREPLTGIVKTPSNLCLLYGTANDCKIAYIAGEIPGQYTKPVPCSFMFNQYGNRFSGWIYFRGHRRPFCGTTTGEFMHACKDW